MQIQFLVMDPAGSIETSESDPFKKQLF